MSAEIIQNDLIIIGGIAIILAGFGIKFIWPLVNANRKWQETVDLSLAKMKTDMEHRFKAVEETQRGRDKTMAQAQRRDELFEKKIDDLIRCVNEIKTDMALVKERQSTMAKGLDDLVGRKGSDTNG